jgi:hypothetical protein
MEYIVEDIAKHLNIFRLQRVTASTYHFVNLYSGEHLYHSACVYRIDLGYTR